MKKAWVFVLSLLLIMTCASCLFACDQTAVSFRISFMVDSEVYATVSTAGNETITLPENPTKEGYTFEGWFLDRNTWNAEFSANSFVASSLSSDILVFAKWEEIPCYFGHTKGELSIENEFAATCTENGGYQEVFYCTVCGQELSRRDKIIDKLGHSFSSEWTIDRKSTCSQVGLKSHHCTVCDATSEETEIPTLSHNFGEWETVVSATCQTEGQTMRTCNVCNFQEYTSVDKTNHTFGAWETISNSTCKDEGQKRRICSVCQAEDFASVPKTTNHSYSSEWTIDREPTCFKKGEKSHHCTVCDARKDIMSIATVPHDYTGENATVCTVCGHEKSGTQIATPTLSISGEKAIWKRVAGAGSYVYTVTNRKGIVKSGTITGNFYSDLYVELEEGQTVTVKAIPSSNENFESSSASVTRAYSPVSHVLNILNGAEKYIKIINDFQKTDIIGLKALLNASFTASKTKDLSVGIQATLDGTTPAQSEALVSVGLNQEDFFAVGYADNKVLIQEPLHKVNSSSTGLGAFYIDATTLQPSVEALVSLGTDKLSNLADYSLETFITDITPTLEKAEIILRLLSFTDEENGVSIGIKCGALHSILKLLPTFFEDGQAKLDAFGENFDTVIDIIRLLDKEMFVLSDGSIVSWQYICDKIALDDNQDNIFLRFSVSYNQEDAIDCVTIFMDFSALDQKNANNAFLLTLDIPLFRQNERVNVPSEEYPAQDLSFSFDIDLDKKGLTATIDTTVALSTAFREKNNIFAVASLTVNDGKNSSTASAYVNDTGVYFDFSDIFTHYSIQAPTCYQYSFLSHLGYCLSDYINREAIHYANGLSTPQNSAVSQKTQDILTKIANLSVSASGTPLKYFLKFNLEQDILSVWEELKQIHETADYETTLLPATHSESKKFGVYLFGNPSLTEYLHYFISIPAVKDGKNDYSTTAELNDIDAFRAWVNCNFHKTSNYRKLIDNFLGESLDEVISEDLYFEAEVYDGLDGKISLNDTPQGDAYISVQGKIVLQNPTNQETLQEYTWDGQNTELTEENANNEYIIIRAFKDLAKALMNE